MIKYLFMACFGWFITAASLISNAAAANDSVYAAPVVFMDDTVITVHSPISLLNAEDRSYAIGKRLTRIYERGMFQPELLTISEQEPVSELLYDNSTVLMVISEFDASQAGVTRKQLAEQHRQKITNVLEHHTEQHSIENLLLRLLKLTGIAFFLLAFIFGINKLFKLIITRLFKTREGWANGIRIGKNEWLSPQTQVLYSMRLLRLVRILLIVIITYASLPFMFAVFPETEQVTVLIIDWTLTPARQILQAVWSFVPNMFTILIVWFIMRFVIRIVRYISDELEAEKIVLNGFHPDWARPTYNIIRFLLYAFTLVVVFPYLPGSGSPAFQGVSVFLGLLLSLGSSSAITNLIAGLVITYMRPFKPGDRIKIGDLTGDVIEKTMLVTRIRTIKNESITIPNSSILSGSVTNYSAFATQQGLILHTVVTIGYDMPWKKVEHALLLAAQRTEWLSSTQKPFVFQLSLDDYYVTYQLNVYTEHPAFMQQIYSSLHAHIQDTFNENGIEIMSPAYTSLRDGNQSTIPRQYHSADYKAPKFNVNNSGE
jgi:small-conductance mechanosensitive channel